MCNQSLEVTLKLIKSTAGFFLQEILLSVFQLFLKEPHPDVSDGWDGDLVTFLL